MKKTIINLCFLCAVSAAHAENWVERVATPHAIYIDLDSLRHQGELVSFLEKETFPVQMNTRLRPTYQEQIFFNQTVSLQIVDCQQLKGTRAETRYLGDSGELVYDQRFDGTWTAIRTDSWMYGVTKEICPARDAG
ncbi:surface-adhesin E family protein [Paraburkholderia sp. JHI869]|uniref:surface-adhesin E family protein n=1 Tax=Paraburkholderia sp. JHI869 TaxID=3112959 RepID=UPI00316BF144